MIPAPLPSLAAAAAGLALLALPASAFAETEPNNGLLQAEGPIAGGATQSGDTPSANDEDWFMFYVDGQAELDVRVTGPESGCGDDGVTLLDGEGTVLGAAFPADGNSVEHIRHTTAPGTNRFYVRADCRAGERYTFRVDPAASIVPGPHPFGAPTALPEPNEFRDQAFGPLAGGTTYSGVTATPNDVDWLFFYAAPSTALDISTISPTSGCGDDGIDLLDDSGQSQGSDFRGGPNRIGHIRHTTPPGTNRYFLKVDCREGEDYQFRIEPATAIVPEPPPPPAPSAECTEARRLRAVYRSRVRRHSASVRRQRSALRRARTVAGRRKASRRLRKAKRDLARARRGLRRAQANVRSHCV